MADDQALDKLMFAEAGAGPAGRRARAARTALLAATALVGWCAQAEVGSAQTISLSGRYTIRPEVVVDLSVLDEGAGEPRLVREARARPARLSEPHTAAAAAALRARPNAAPQLADAGPPRERDAVRRPGARELRTAIPAEAPQVGGSRLTHEQMGAPPATAATPPQTRRGPNLDGAAVPRSATAASPVFAATPDCREPAPTATPAAKALHADAKPVSVNNQVATAAGTSPRQGKRVPEIAAAPRDAVRQTSTGTLARPTNPVKPPGSPVPIAAAVVRDSAAATAPTAGASTSTAANPAFPEPAAPKPGPSQPDAGHHQLTAMLPPGPPSPGPRPVQTVGQTFDPPTPPQPEARGAASPPAAPSPASTDPGSPPDPLRAQVATLPPARSAPAPFPAEVTRETSDAPKPTVRPPRPEPLESQHPAEPSGEQRLAAALATGPSDATPRTGRSDPGQPSSPPAIAPDDPQAVRLPTPKPPVPLTITLAQPGDTSRALGAGQAAAPQILSNTPAQFAAVPPNLPKEKPPVPVVSDAAGQSQSLALTQSEVQQPVSLPRPKPAAPPPAPVLFPNHNDESNEAAVVDEFGPAALLASAPPVPLPQPKPPVPPRAAVAPLPTGPDAAAEGPGHLGTLSAPNGGPLPAASPASLAAGEAPPARVGQDAGVAAAPYPQPTGPAPQIAESLPILPRIKPPVPESAVAKAGGSTVPAASPAIAAAPTPEQLAGLAEALPFRPRSKPPVPESPVIPKADANATPSSDPTPAPLPRPEQPAQLADALPFLPRTKPLVPDSTVANANPSAAPGTSPTSAAAPTPEQSTQLADVAPSVPRTKPPVPDSTVANANPSAAPGTSPTSAAAPAPEQSTQLADVAPSVPRPKPPVPESAVVKADASAAPSTSPPSVAAPTSEQATRLADALPFLPRPKPPVPANIAPDGLVRAPGSALVSPGDKPPQVVSSPSVARPAVPSTAMAMLPAPAPTPLLTFMKPRRQGGEAATAPPSGPQGRPGDATGSDAEPKVAPASGTDQAHSPDGKSTAAKDLALGGDGGASAALSATKPPVPAASVAPAEPAAGSVSKEPAPNTTARQREPSQLAFDFLPKPKPPVPAPPALTTASASQALEPEAAPPVAASTTPVARVPEPAPPAPKTAASASAPAPAVSAAVKAGASAHSELPEVAADPGRSTPPPPISAPAGPPASSARSATAVVDLPVFGALPKRAQPASPPPAAETGIAANAPVPQPPTGAPRAAPTRTPQAAPTLPGTITDQLAARTLPVPGSAPQPGGPSLIGAATASPLSRAVTPTISAPGPSAARLLFQPGSAELPGNVSASLSGLAERLRSNPASHLLVVSFASSTAADENASRVVSLSRAIAVRNYLIGQHVSTGQMDMRAQGDRFKDGGPLDRVDLVLLER